MPRHRRNAPRAAGTAHTARLRRQAVRARAAVQRGVEGEHAQRWRRAPCRMSPSASGRHRPRASCPGLSGVAPPYRSPSAAPAPALPLSAVRRRCLRFGLPAALVASLEQPCATSPTASPVPSRDRLQVAGRGACATRCSAGRPPRTRRKRAARQIPAACAAPRAHPPPRAGGASAAAASAMAAAAAVGLAAPSESAAGDSSATKPEALRCVAMVSAKGSRGSSSISTYVTPCRAAPSAMAIPRRHVPQWQARPAGRHVDRACTGSAGLSCSTHARRGGAGGGHHRQFVLRALEKVQRAGTIHAHRRQSCALRSATRTQSSWAAEDRRLHHRGAPVSHDHGRLVRRSHADAHNALAVSARCRRI